MQRAYLIEFSLLSEQMIWDLYTERLSIIQFHQQLFRQQQQKNPRWTEYGHAISRPKRGLHMISRQNVMRTTLVWHFTLAYMDGRKVSSKHKPFVITKRNVRGTQRQFSENVCSEDDLRCRINFQNICCKISCFPASPRIFKHLKNGIIAHF